MSTAKFCRSGINRPWDFCMCITLSLKVGKKMGHNKHCPGVKGLTPVTGGSIDSFKDTGAEEVVGPDDRLIGPVMDEVVAVVSGISVGRLDQLVYARDVVRLLWVLMYSFQWL